MAFCVDDLPMKVIKSNRKTLSIEVNGDGILVRAPFRMSRREIYSFVVQKSDWIEKHYKKIQEKKRAMEEVVPYTEAELKELAKKALEMIPEKVKYYAEIIGVDYGRITIRNQRTRWGSCSSKGNLNFNCLLMLFPDPVIDSVVVHELCHRKHMNHSKEFYQEVRNAFPQYDRCHKWLKENGSLYMKKCK